MVETFGDVFQSPQELLQPQQLCEVLHIFYVQKFFFSADNFKPTIRIVLESNHVPLLNFESYITVLLGQNLTHISHIFHRPRLACIYLNSPKKPRHIPTKDIF